MNNNNQSNSNNTLNNSGNNNPKNNNNTSSQSTIQNDPSENAIHEMKKEAQNSKELENNNMEVEQ
jgi:hypothetical protein